MGVDLYAGPLARYYSGEWETQAAAWARANGVAFETVYSSSPPNRLSPDESAEAVQAFRTRVAPKLGVLPQWSKASDPYEIYQLRAEGFSSVVLAAALLHRPELKRPTKIPVDIQEHPAVSEASTRGYYIGPMAAFEAQVIVPGEEPRICGETDCRGGDVVVVTLSVLQDAVEAVRVFLGFSAQQLDAILAKGPPESGPEIAVPAKTGWIFSKPKYVQDEFLEWAGWGLACFRACARFAQDTGAAIIRDE